MRRLTFAELDRERHAFDTLAALGDGIDRFCSSSIWGLPAHGAFGGGRHAMVAAASGAYLALAVGSSGGLRLAQPLEACWGLGCPIVTDDPKLGAALFFELLAEETARWDVALLSGVVPNTDLYRTLAAGARGQLRVSLGPITRRYRASLTGGVDGFLARRSRHLRKSLRRAERHAVSLGIELEDASAHTHDATLLERIVAIEAKSWKGRSGQGIDCGPMLAFYTLMLPRLRERGALRLLFAKRGEVDVGFILGGVFANTYRGLQFSFDNELRHVGLGNLAQLEQVRRLCAEGTVSHYDLGAEVDYKARWGEEVMDTVALFFTR